MTYHIAPWAFMSFERAIGHRIGHFQHGSFGNRVQELHKRLTGVPEAEQTWALDDWVQWKNGMTSLDAIGCWFLLLLLHDRDVGVRSKATAPQEFEAISNASTLLRRWLEGDPTEAREWKELLPNPGNLADTGDWPSISTVASGVGRMFFYESMVPVLDAAAHVHVGSQLPKSLTKPLKLKTYDVVVQCIAFGLVFPFAIWVSYRDRSRIRLNPKYYQALGRLMLRLSQLRWNPQDAEEARLFPLVVGRQNLDQLPQYLACLRRLHVEPNEIADTEDILRRMSDVAKAIGLEFQDERYVTGMATRRLYSVEAPPPAFLMAHRSLFYNSSGNALSYYMTLNGNVLVVNGETTKASPLKNWQKFETDQDLLASVGHTESRESQSRRVFVRSQPQQDYFVIEFDWSGAINRSSNDETGDGSKAPNAFRVSVRSGQWPTKADVWDRELDQHFLWMEFTTRSTALAWYRQEIDRQLHTGFTEVLPRLTYFSCKVRAVPAVEGKVLFDSNFPTGTIEANWIEKHQRTAFAPVVQTEPSSANSSKLAGEIMLPQGTGWPNCPACKRPMDLLIQLNLNQLPNELQTPFGAGLLQFFHCSNEMECSGERGPFSETQLGRILSINERLEAVQPPESKSRSPKSIIGWTPQTDSPARDDYYNLDYDELDQSNFYEVDRMELMSKRFPPIPTDKLSGFPRVVQGDDYCPECHERMRLIYQMHSSGPIAFSTFENTTGLLVQCPNHPDKIALTTYTE